MAVFTFVYLSLHEIIILWKRCFEIPPSEYPRLNTLCYAHLHHHSSCMLVVSYQTLDVRLTRNSTQNLMQIWDKIWLFVIKSVCFEWQFYQVEICHEKDKFDWWPGNISFGYIIGWWNLFWLWTSHKSHCYCRAVIWEHILWFSVIICTGVAMLVSCAVTVFDSTKWRLSLNQWIHTLVVIYNEIWLWLKS